MENSKNSDKDSLGNIKNIADVSVKKEYSSELITSISAYSNRLSVGDDLNRANQVADIILNKYPNLEVYTISAGISPSGTIHFGNFRDVMTSLAVIESLKQKGKKVNFVFSWDNFDRFRKVPKGLNEEFEKYIGMPLTSVPDPIGELNSYADRYQKDFEDSMKELGIEMNFKYQTEEYSSGKYDESIKLALEKRKDIAKVILSSMSDKGKDNKNINEQEFINSFYPIVLYSRYTNKDNTKILSINGNLIKYKCLETGNIDEIDFTKDRLVKLNRKIDRPMRWKHEGVLFEPGGIDHATPGGSYDTSSVISKQVFNNDAPFFVGYSFIGIQGIDGKMSGSAGNAISVKDLLKIYDPFLLKRLYFKKVPGQEFNLAFDSEVYRQYEEFDAFVGRVINGEASNIDLDIYAKLGLEFKEYNPIPFRQAVSFGQIVQWNPDKLKELLNKAGFNYSDSSIITRLAKGKKWLEEYNPNDSIEVFSDINQDYINNMNNEQKKRIRLLSDGIRNGLLKDDLNTLIYSIPKDHNLSKQDNKKLQRDFFIDVYNLLIGKETGPRLSTFISLLDQEKVLKLLNI